MSNATLMAPVFMHVALLFFILVKMGRARAQAVRSREVKIRQIALSSQAWSDEVKKVSNNYINQLQLPVVMYVAVAFYIILGKVDMVAVGLAWLFVITRLVHAYIHITSNFVLHRFRAFVAGVFLLMAMWGWLAIRLYITG